MFGYYLNLALRSFRRNKVLTALMVFAIALGIGACMTTLTVFHVLSGDPLPGKSHQIFYVQLDPADMKGYVAGQEPADQVTRFDAETLLREHRGDRQAMMTGGNVSITPDKSGMIPFLGNSRYTSADFFPMFDVPLAQGRAWTKAEDDAHARVVVISKSLNDKLFGGGNSVGRKVRLDQSDFTIVGVVADWRPTPKFYDMYNDRYGTLEDVFVPFSTAIELKMSHSGSTDCWSENNGDAYALNVPCTWIQYWVELDSPDKVAAYRSYLENYSNQQHAAGRYQRPTNVRLRDVMEWLTFSKVVPNDVVMQLWLGFGFLLVCLVNTVGLLLAKFLRRSGEIGVRRALGASRRSIFAQYLVEAGAVGLAGGIAGLGLSLLGLWAVRQQPASYAELAHIDLGMLLLTFVLAIVASILAGLLPAWSAMQVAPAVQLKSQ
ncbi:MAG: ABC transporter permease [Thermomonas sp.]